MTPTIPEDIIGGVVDVLWTTDLRSCALVSHVFRALCQRRLFHSVVLDTRYCERNDYEHLHLILLDNPVLASFIRSLRIFVLKRLHGSPLKAVCGILHIVRPHVRKLAIDGNVTRGNTWKSYPESLKTALLNIIVHSSCVDLELGHVGLPMTYISQSSHLQHLRLTHDESVTIHEEGSSDLRHGVQKPQGYLESLVVRSPVAAERIVQALHTPGRPARPCPLSLTGFFQLSFDEPRFHLLQAILDLAADHLQEISLYASFDISSYPDFSRLKHLRIVHLIFKYTPDIPLGVCVIRMIESIPAGTIELGFTIDERHHLMVIKDSEWREIDALLSHERHATLQRVTFYGFKCEEGDLLRFSSRKLPRLTEKGVLMVG
ncbi:hypothetical protein FPV67DRAFT_1707721 [Lyophyllum atratum]|nr:hypothetical protein FPV67DRAFT_1707721 [Lyophyllum atratum]